jgi:transposase
MAVDRVEQDAVVPIICIDARHAKAALKLQINKSDRNDAVGIARIMQCGWYKEVRVKDLDSHAIKALLVQPSSARQ